MKNFRSGLADYDYLYTGTIQGIDRVGIPTIHMEDGPQGFRCEDPANYGTTTAWPSAMTIAAAWDQDLLAKWGKAMSDEFKYKGASIILGPGVGVARVPTGGRNFEYLCGEDPSFCSLLVPSLIKSIQDNGIIANAKHFVNNEIEKDRQQMSSNVGERARFEIYYPPFEAAADAGVLSVMCSYNRVNDVYACENSETLNHLRENLGFDGWVMSDWWATMSTGKAIKAGLDQEMPYGYWYQFSNMTAALESGEINEADIDRSVSRILTAMYAIGVFDRPAVGDRKANVTSDAHNQLAREIAAKSTVLLQNKNYLLPLNKNSLGKCVAVFGDEDTVHGGGSGSVEGPYIITPKMGLVNALAGTQTEVIYSDGKDLAAAKDLAASCETAVVVVATNSGEGDDRANLSLDGNYDSLVSTVAAVNPRTIVSVRTPGAVLMPWTNEVGAILVSWLGGQEAGNGLADVLFGKVNPYARLHVSMPNKENEVGFTPEQYPGVGNPPEASYSEELLIGYR
jgi:beta-glucosidase